MPQVPVYDSNVQTKPIAAPTFSAPASVEDFGGGQRPVTSDLTKGIVDFADSQKKRFDQVNIQDYDTALSKVQTDLEAKASQMKGKDAAGAIGLVQEGWKTSLDSLDSMLNNEEQRAAAKRLANNRFESLYKNVQMHTAKELTDYDVESTNSTIANAKDEAVRNYMDPKAVEAALSKQQAAIVLFADTYHKGNDQWLEESLNKNLSKTHSDVITRMLDNNQDLLAKATYNNVKDQLNGNDAADLEKKLRIGSVKGESQRQTDSIMAQGLSYADARSKAKEIQDPDTREETLKNIETEYAAKEKNDKYNEEAVVHDLTKKIVETGGNVDLPTSTLSQLPIEKIKAIRDFKNKETLGEDVPDNTPTYLNLSLLSHDPKTRDDFANRDIPSETLNKVSSKQRNELIDSWLKIREKDEVHTDFLNYKNQNDQVIADSLDAIGKSHWYTLGGLGDQEAADYQVSVRQEIKNQEKALKRNLTTDEAKAIADKYAVKVVVGSGIFGASKLPVGSLRPENLDISAIPSDLQSKARQSLKSRGLETSDQNVIKLYVEALKAGKIRPSGNE